MNEKVYRSMSLAGACNIAVGIVILVVGIAAGVMAIVSGAGLLKTKKTQNPCWVRNCFYPTTYVYLSVLSH